MAAILGFYLHVAALLAAARCGYALAAGAEWQELWLLGLVVSMSLVVISGLAGLESWIGCARTFVLFRWQLASGAALGALVGTGACLFVLLASLSLLPSGLRAGIVGVSVMALAQTAGLLAFTVATFGLYGVLAARVAWRVLREGDEATFDSVLDDDAPDDSASAIRAPAAPAATAAPAPTTGTPGWADAERLLADVAGGRMHPGHVSAALATTLRLAPSLTDAEAARARTLIVRLCASPLEFRADARSADGDPDAPAARVPASVAEAATRALNAWDAARGARRAP